LRSMGNLTVAHCPIFKDFITLYTRLRRGNRVSKRQMRTPGCLSLLATNTTAPALDARLSQTMNRLSSSKKLDAIAIRRTRCLNERATTEVLRRVCHCRRPGCSWTLFAAMQRQCMLASVHSPQCSINYDTCNTGPAGTKQLYRPPR
jgi:hypothetical protein